jgi:hypothetical protein
MNPKKLKLPKEKGRRKTKNFNKVKAAVPLCLWYIDPKKAIVKKEPLPKDMKNEDYEPMRIAEWRRMDYSNKEIDNIIDNPAPRQHQNRLRGKGKRAGTDRPLKVIVNNRSSSRNQRYLAPNGLLSEHRGQGERGDVPNDTVAGMISSTNAQLFYGVRGVVAKGSYMMSAPADFYQGIPADPTIQHELPCPEDVIPAIRQALARHGRILPKFRDFLKRNFDIAEKYKLDPETGAPIVAKKAAKENRETLDASTTSSPLEKHTLGSASSGLSSMENNGKLDEQSEVMPQWKIQQAAPPQAPSRKRGAKREECDVGMSNKKRKTSAPNDHDDFPQFTAPAHMPTPESFYGGMEHNGHRHGVYGSPSTAPTSQNTEYVHPVQGNFGLDLDFDSNIYHGFPQHSSSHGRDLHTSLGAHVPASTRGVFDPDLVGLYDLQDPMPTKSDLFGNVLQGTHFRFDDPNQFFDSGSDWSMGYMPAGSPLEGEYNEEGDVGELSRFQANGYETGQEGDLEGQYGYGGSFSYHPNDGFDFA